MPRHERDEVVTRMRRTLRTYVMMSPHERAEVFLSCYLAITEFALYF